MGIENQSLARLIPNRSRGFTIVELLIVIVVIGVLATIAIIAYSGIQDRAIASSLQSDLNGASKQLEAHKVLYGSYPENHTETNDGEGLSSSPGTIFEYDSDGNTYCLTAASTRPGVSAYSVESGGAITEGACPGHSLGDDINGGSIEFVQSWAGGTTGNTVNRWGGNATSSGSLLVIVYAVRDQNFSTATVSDTSGNNWIEVARHVNPDSSVAQIMWYAANSNPVSQVEVSITGPDGESPPVGAHAGHLMEFTGAGSLIDYKAGTGGSATLTSLHTVTPQSGGLVVGGMSAAVTNRTWGSADDYEHLTHYRGGQVTLGAAYKVVSSNDATSPRWERLSGSSATVGIITAAFATD